jgi:hypothetical protein
VLDSNADESDCGDEEEGESNSEAAPEHVSDDVPIAPIEDEPDQLPAFNADAPIPLSLPYQDDMRKETIGEKVENKQTDTTNKARSLLPVEDRSDLVGDADHHHPDPLGNSGFIGLEYMKERLSDLSMQNQISHI